MHGPDSKRPGPARALIYAARPGPVFLDIRPGPARAGPKSPVKFFRIYFFAANLLFFPAKFKIRTNNVFLVIRMLNMSIYGYIGVRLGLRFEFFKKKLKLQQEYIFRNSADQFEQKTPTLGISDMEKKMVIQVFHFGMILGLEIFKNFQNFKI